MGRIVCQMGFQEPSLFRNEKIAKELQLSFSSTEEQLWLLSKSNGRSIWYPRVWRQNCPLISQPWSLFCPCSPHTFSPQIKLLHISPGSLGSSEMGTREERNLEIPVQTQYRKLHQLHCLVTLKLLRKKKRHSYSEISKTSEAFGKNKDKAWWLHVYQVEF